MPHKDSTSSDLSNQILHPDIILPILSFLPPTHLPSVIRSSRYLHTLATPLLYTDLPLGTLTRTSLCPHLSPLGTLFPPSSSSTSDLRSILHDRRKNRKRYALESARTLRVGYHTHSTLPPMMEHLRLDMSSVETLHIEGNAICHQDACPIFLNLKPKVVVLESTSLARDRIGGLALDTPIEHLVIKLRPTNFAIYPSSSTSSTDRTPSLPLFSSLQRLTIIFTPYTYLDRKGQEVKETWRPTSRSRCGEYYWTVRPIFTDLLKHIAEASKGVSEVRLVGGEQLDREWVEAEHEEESCIRLRKAGWLDNEMIRIRKEMMGEDADEAGKGLMDISCEDLGSWRVGRDGYLLDAPAVSAGFKGKGVPSHRPALIHKAILCSAST